jgi:hypothetical protein
MRRVLLALAPLALVSGCSYSTARLDYERHPLRSVRLWSGESSAAAAATKLGPVEARRDGWKDCDAMATDATLELLNDARAMGGAGVAETRYENAAYWSGILTASETGPCWAHDRLARGFAVKDTRQSPTAGCPSLPSPRAVSSAQGIPVAPGVSPLTIRSPRAHALSTRRGLVNASALFGRRPAFASSDRERSTPSRFTGSALGGRA